MNLIFEHLSRQDEIYQDAFVLGDFHTMLGYAHDAPFLLANLSGIGCSLAVAVMCYTTLIKKAGSVAAVSIGTIRKIVTIGLSYILFPKELLPIHKVSTVCVVLGIVMEAFKKPKPSQPASDKDSKIALLQKSGVSLIVRVFITYTWITFLQTTLPILMHRKCPIAI